MTADVYDLKGDKSGTVDLPQRIFGVPWNASLVAQVLRAQRANARRPWAHAKGRSEVRGGGRKPWRQKGTGRARHGSIRSPLWRGGGKAHGPNKERDYSQKINKKMRQLATKSLLSKKFVDKEITIFTTLEIAEPKTKPLANLLRPLLRLPKRKKTYDLLFIPAEKNLHLFRAARNLSKTKVLEARNLNVYDLLNYHHIFIDRNALPLIERHCRMTAKETR